MLYKSAFPLFHCAIEPMKRIMRDKKRTKAPFLVRTLVAIPTILVMLVGFLTMPALAAYAGYSTALNEWETLPAELEVPDYLPQHSTMLDSDGNVIATFYAENRVPISLNQIPDSLINAIIATEDSRFFEHNGVDWRGTLRALLNNVRGLPQQGGSGITQQYVKNLLVLEANSQEELEEAKGNSYWRKLREARFALSLEEKMSKEQILEAYLNTVYFGDRAYGIGAAAKHYFNKTPKQLTLAESALLAGIINSPTAYNPVTNLNNSLDRREHVLGRMLSEEYITKEEYDFANNEEVVLDLVVPANGCIYSTYPLYCQWVRTILENDPVFGETAEKRQEFLYRGGLTIETALNPKIQKIAQDATRKALAPKNRVSTAVAVVEPGTGHVAALATNKPFGQKKGQTEILLPVAPAFQNGSTFKPLTAAAALELGISPNIVINAGPRYIPEKRNYPEGGFKNAGDGPGGTLDMAGALRRSTNTWFIELEDMIGVKNVARVAKNMGLSSLPLEGKNAITEKDAALTLGAWETSPLEVANSYATLAAHGVACNPVGIVSITNKLGENIPVPDPDCKQVISASTADTVTSMLIGVVDGTDPSRTGRRASLGDRPVTGKTGSTDGYGAAWFAGYTPQYATAVWVGDIRGPKFGMSNGVGAYNGTQFFKPVYGGTIPALIWRDIMQRTHKGLPIKNFEPGGGESLLGIPLVVPNVVGLTKEQAARVISDAGFTPTFVEGEVEGLPNMPEKAVVKTVPAAGTQIALKGRTITLYLP
jgi:membrane peptidoglycan carboxypeptidase